MKITDIKLRAIRRNTERHCLVWQGLAFLGPRTFQIDDRLERLIAEGILTENELKHDGYGDPPRRSWGELLIASFAFIAVTLGLACWRFSTRDG